MRHKKAFIIKQEHIGKVISFITKETQYTLNSFQFDPMHLALVCDFSSREDLVQFDTYVAPYSRKTC